MSAHARLRHWRRNNRPFFWALPGELHFARCWAVNVSQTKLGVKILGRTRAFVEVDVILHGRQARTCAICRAAHVFAQIFGRDGQEMIVYLLRATTTTATARATNESSREVGFVLSRIHTHRASEVASQLASEATAYVHQRARDINLLRDRTKNVKCCPPNLSLRVVALLDLKFSVLNLFLPSASTTRRSVPTTHPASFEDWRQSSDTKGPTEDSTAVGNHGYEHGASAPGFNRREAFRRCSVDALGILCGKSSCRS